MATIRLRNDKYQVLVRMHGISISKTFTKKSHAQKWAKSTEVAIECGQYSESPELTVKDAFIEYQQSKLSHDKRSLPHIKNAASPHQHMTYSLQNDASREQQIALTFQKVGIAKINYGDEDYELPSK